MQQQNDLDIRSFRLEAILTVSHGVSPHLID